MAKLPLLDASSHVSGTETSRRPTRRATLARLEDVAQTHVGADTPIDRAFGALEALGPDAGPAQVAALQDELRQLLSEGMDGPQNNV